MNGRATRRGFTLFEVILSLAIVGGALAVISQVVYTGMESARMTRELVQAELLAETVMSELLVGIRPVESAGETAFDDEAGLEDAEGWLYSVDVGSTETEGLVQATVTVRVNSDKPRTVEYSLVRWIYTGETEEE